MREQRFRFWVHAVLMLLVVGVVFQLDVQASAVTFQGVDAQALGEAGQRLEEFTTQFYFGFWVGVGGSLLTAVGMVTGGETGATMVLAGGLTQLVGSLISFFAYDKIAKAGAALRRAAASAL